MGFRKQADWSHTDPLIAIDSQELSFTAEPGRLDHEFLENRIRPGSACIRVIQHVADIQIIELVTRFRGIGKVSQRAEPDALSFEGGDCWQIWRFVKGGQVKLVVEKMLVDGETAVLGKGQALRIVIEHIRTRRVAPCSCRSSNRLSHNAEPIP